MPLLEWTIIPFMSLTGESVAIIRVIRLVMFLLSCASLWVLYRIGREVLTGPTQALLVVLLVMGSRAWVTKSPEIRSDNLMLLFALLSFWVLVRYYRAPKPWHLFLFGVLAVLSFLGKQTALVFYAPLAVVFAWDAVFVRKRFSWKIVVAGLAALAQLNPLRGFLILHLNHLIPNAIRFPATINLAKGFWLNPALFTLFAFQLVRPLRLSDAGRPLVKYMFSIVFFELVVLFMLNRPFAQEHMVMTVFMGLLASGVGLALSGKWSWKIGCILAVALAAPALHDLSMNSMKCTLTADLEITRTVLKVSDRNDSVFDAYGKAIFRHHPLDPSFMVYMPKRFQRLDEPKQKDVPYVIWDPRYFVKLLPIVQEWIWRNCESISENTNILLRIEC
jgi:hypothetical protein